MIALDGELRLERRAFLSSVAEASRSSSASIVFGHAADEELARAASPCDLPATIICARELVADDLDVGPVDLIAVRVIEVVMAN